MATPVPIIKCKQIGNPKIGFFWRFLCPHCFVHHTHPPGARRRAAQCQDRRSPYAKTGYMLELAGPKKIPARPEPGGVEVSGAT